jgi:flagellar FliL protein
MAMTAVEEAPAEAEAPKKKKMSGKKLVLFILLPVLLLGGGGAAAYFFLLKKPAPDAAQAADAAAAEEAAAPPFYKAMDELQDNLVSTGKRSNFLRLSLWLQVKNEDESKKLDGVMPRIVDQFHTYLRSLRIEDLQGADGVQRMRDELLMRARAAAKPVEVDDVLIKAMLAQ